MKKKVLVLFYHQRKRVSQSLKKFKKKKRDQSNFLKTSTLPTQGHFLTQRDGYQNGKEKNGRKKKESNPEPRGLQM